MTVYVVVVRVTNEYVGVYSSFDNIPDEIMDNDEHYRIIKETV